MTILWYSDSPVTETGFAQVAKKMIAHFGKANKIICVGIGHNKFWYDKKVYPCEIVGNWKDYFCENELNRFLLDPNFKFDILFTFHNTEVINKFIPTIKKARTFKKFKWITYSPIDADFNYPHIYDSLKYADKSVTYTRFGRKVIERQVKKDILIVPHGVEESEHNLVSKIDKEQKQDIRKLFFNDRLKAEDKLVLNVNRNQWRKDLPRSMWAIDELTKSYPNAKLYIHAKVKDIGGELDVYKKTTVKNKNSVILNSETNFPINDFRQGIPREQMKYLYAISDVVITTSVGEGWGLSISEAMNIGIPVVVPRHTSFVEIVEGKGRCVDDWEGKTIFYETKNHTVRKLVDPFSMAMNIKAVVNNDVSTEIMRKKALDWAKEHFWSNILEQWNSIFYLP